MSRKTTLKGNLLFIFKFSNIWSLISYRDNDAADDDPEEPGTSSQVSPQVYFII